MSDNISATVSQSSLRFADVEHGLSKESLVFRVIHFWEARNPKKNGMLMGLELLLIDEQATVIQGFIAPNRMNRYEGRLKRNGIYSLTNFYATKNKDMYRVSDHDFTLCFTDLSILTQLTDDDYSIDAQSFRLRTFDEFEHHCDRRGDLYDIMGHLRLINGQSLQQHPVIDSDGPQDNRLSIHLQPKEGPIVHINLWDNAAAELRSKLNARSSIPRVMLVTTVNPKRIGGRVTLSSMSSSRVFLDDDVLPTREYLTWLGDNASIVATLNASQVTKVETLTIGEIKNFLSKEPPQIASFECIAKIDDVRREYGWYYIACTECQTKVSRGTTSLVCTKCNNQNAVGVNKFRVEISVHDNDDKATFVLLDDAGADLTGRNATDLMDEYLAVNGDMGPGQEIPIPQVFFDAINQTHKFKVKVTKYNFGASRQTITVTKVLQAAELPLLTPKNHGPTLPGDEKRKSKVDTEESKAYDDTNNQPPNIDQQKNTAVKISAENDAKRQKRNP